MLKEIKLKNFKCFFGEVAFSLSKINLLTGINGRGKSSFLQSILLMCQTVQHNQFPKEIVLNGNAVNLGEYRDIKNSDASEDVDNIAFCFTEEQGAIFSFDIIEDKGNVLLKNFETNAELSENNPFLSKIGGLVGSFITARLKLENNLKLMGLSDEENLQEKLNELDLPEFIKNIVFSGLFDLSITNGSEAKETSINKLAEIFFESLFQTNGTWLLNYFRNTHYISADRLGGQEYYKKYNNSDFVHISKRGENTASVLSHVKEQLVQDSLYLGEDAKTVITQVGEWLSHIFDAKVEIIIEDNSSPYIINLDFRVNGKDYKPNNVGFGYSYILPIIVSGLIAKKGDILIVENPEAHLHPKAQSHLMKFLAKVVSNGVQIFIESHSEHILRALQICVKKEELSNDDLNVLYFQSDGFDSKVIRVPVLRDGTIEEWPEGFFDQDDEDYKILFGF